MRKNKHINFIFVLFDLQASIAPLEYVAIPFRYIASAFYCQTAAYRLPYRLLLSVLLNTCPPASYNTPSLSTIPITSAQSTMASQGSFPSLS